MLFKIDKRMFKVHTKECSRFIQRIAGSDDGMMYHMLHCVPYNFYLYLFLKKAKFSPKFLIWSVWFGPSCIIDKWTLNPKKDLFSRGTRPIILSGPKTISALPKRKPGDMSRRLFYFYIFLKCFYKNIFSVSQFTILYSYRHVQSAAQLPAPALGPRRQEP